MNCRKRTSSKFIGYGLYLYFLGLSFINAAKALKWFVKISHVSIWKWLKKYKPQKISTKKKKTIDEYIINETIIKAGSEYIWSGVAIEPKDREILGISISRAKYVFVAERFLYDVVEEFGQHSVSIDGERTWYPPQACQFQKLKHHVHSSFEKSIFIERTTQYIKDRNKEGFDDYFPYKRKEKCRL
jgi:putative transposase